MKGCMTQHRAPSRIWNVFGLIRKCNIVHTSPSETSARVKLLDLRVLKSYQLLLDFLEDAYSFAFFAYLDFSVLQNHRRNTRSGSDCSS